MLRVWTEELRQAVSGFEDQIGEDVESQFVEAVLELNHVLRAEGIPFDPSLVDEILEAGENSDKVQACIAKCRQGNIFQRAVKKVQKFGRQTAKRFDAFRNPDEYQRVQDQGHPSQPPQRDQQGGDRYRYQRAPNERDVPWRNGRPGWEQGSNRDYQGRSYNPQGQQQPPRRPQPQPGQQQRPQQQQRPNQPQRPMGPPQQRPGQPPQQQQPQQGQQPRRKRPNRPMNGQQPQQQQQPQQGQARMAPRPPPRGSRMNPAFRGSVGSRFLQQGPRR